MLFLQGFFFVARQTIQKVFWGLRPDVSAPKATMKAYSARTKVLQLNTNEISLTYRGSTLDVMMPKIKYVCGLGEICY